MKRYIPQFHRGGFPELYVVADTYERDIVSDPQPYHEANDEAEARNAGTFGQQVSAEAWTLAYHSTLPFNYFKP